MDSALLIAIVGTIGTVLGAVITVVANRRKTAAEGKKISLDGDAAIVNSASAFLQQSGEFGQRLMERISALEEQLELERTERRALERQLSEVRETVTRYESRLASQEALEEELVGYRAYVREVEREVTQLREENARLVGTLEANGIQVVVTPVPATPPPIFRGPNSGPE